MVTITENAVKEICGIIEKENMTGHHLRLGVAGGGCSGLQYFLGFDNNIKESDDSFEFEGFKVLIDKEAVEVLKGSTLDYSTENDQPGFIFNNPNAPKPPECGGSCCC